MALTRISIPVTTDEREALCRLAEKELRTSRDQARYIIQRAILDAQVPVANGHGLVTKTLQSRETSADGPT